ncbi:MAG TPA: glucose-1-phosphate adenylyltransferase [Bryobacterales bacterium]|nr:glucose-1-phosphate adenylyltransferase [Bryobacterales bacterium]
MEHISVLGIILAGGKGERLFPLTTQRSKPAVPFAGKYRIIDFVLSNFINSGIYSIYILTQFKSQSLLQHLREGWQFSDLLKNQFIIPVPAQMRKGEQWYQGTTDAIFQNIHLLELANPELVAVFGADHIYRMNVSHMVAYHKRKGAEGTVAALPIPVAEAARFGTMEIDEDWRILRFLEKVERPPEIPGRPGWCLASMGNYVFDGGVLKEELKRDADHENSSHDFGKDILPWMTNNHALYAYDFHRNLVPGEKEKSRGYWRDVGTIEAYYEANLDLRSVEPMLNLYNPLWPLRTAEYHEGPAKFTFDEDGRRGQALNSIICEGCILAGGRVVDSVLGRRVFVDNGAQVKESVVMDNCQIGAGARIQRAILDKNAVIPAGERIGYDLDQDREKYHVSETGIVVVEGHRSAIPLSPVAI